MIYDYFILILCIIIILKGVGYYNLLKMALIFHEMATLFIQYFNRDAMKIKKRKKLFIFNAISKEEK